ncbi:MAG TPA: hypothetical protein VGG54_23360 [Trebonia sp.]
MAEEHPTRLIRYDLAKRERSVEVSALDDYCVSNDGTQLAYQVGESLEIKPASDPDGEVIGVDLDRIRAGRSSTGTCTPSSGKTA